MDYYYRPVPLSTYGDVTRKSRPPETEAEKYCREKMEKALEVFEAAITQDVADMIHRWMDRESEKLERRKQNLMMAKWASQKIREQNHVETKIYLDANWNPVVVPNDHFYRVVDALLEKFWIGETE